MGEEFSTDWDVEAYHTDHETDDHWQLKKRFMELHKDKFPEDRLVCLAQVFTNMEFMGCKYPTETMRVVAELAVDVAQEYRTQRAGKLKRTFVSAKDAAESRAKGRKNTQHQEEGGPSTSNAVTKDGQPPPSKKSKAGGSDLFQGLSFGKFVLFMVGGRNCLRLSAQRCGMEFNELEVAEEENKKIEIHLDNKLVAFAVEENVKVSKAEAFRKALETLQTNCYSIQPKPLRDTIKIEKANNRVICGVSKQCNDELDEKRLDATNKGYKMMKSMGWSGGGLGSNTQGRIDPVGYLFKNNRAGLGNETANKFDRKYFKQMLRNYVNSEDIRDLQFESSFTKEERAMLHEIAGKLHLRSVSRGKGDDRRLIISKRSITNEHILQEVLVNGNAAYTDLYHVQVPESKAQLYPDYTAKLSVEFP